MVEVNDLINISSRLVVVVVEVRHKWEFACCRLLVVEVSNMMVIVHRTSAEVVSCRL